MRYFVCSYQRAKLQITLASMPPSILAKMELCVVPSQYKEYKAEWYGNKVKAIHVWPKYFDMLGKKRKYLCTHINEDFLMFDDDLRFFPYNSKTGKHIPSSDPTHAKRMERELLERIPALFERYDMVSLPFKFMAPQAIEKHGLEKVHGIHGGVWGFAKGRGKELDYNQIYTSHDTYLPLQALKKFKGNTVTYFGLCWDESKIKALHTTGIGPLTEILEVDSILKIAQYMPGIITGIKQNVLKLDLQMKRHQMRLVNGVKPVHIEASNLFIQRTLEQYGLRKLPAKFVYEDKMPREEIIRTIENNWEAAKGFRTKKLLG